jgi:hypothetical protein
LHLARCHLEEHPELRGSVEFICGVRQFVEREPLLVVVNELVEHAKSVVGDVEKAPCFAEVPLRSIPRSSQCRLLLFCPSVLVHPT